MGQWWDKHGAKVQAAAFAGERETTAPEFNEYPYEVGDFGAEIPIIVGAAAVPPPTGVIAGVIISLFGLFGYVGYKVVKDIEKEQKRLTPKHRGY